MNDALLISDFLEAEIEANKLGLKLEVFDIVFGISKNNDDIFISPYISAIAAFLIGYKYGRSEAY